MKLICITCVFLFYLNVVISGEGGFFVEKEYSVSDLRSEVDAYEANIRQVVSKLATRYSGETDPYAKSKFTTRVEYFEKEITKVSQETYLHALEICRGNVSRCWEEMDRYMQDTFEKLYLRILRFELDSYFYFNKYSSEENSSSQTFSDLGNMTGKDVRDRVQTIWNMVVMKVHSLHFKVIAKPLNVKDGEEKNYESDIALLFKLGKVTKMIYDDALRICGGDEDDSKKNLTCSQNPMRFIERRFTFLWSYAEEFEKELVRPTPEEGSTERSSQA